MRQIGILTLSLLLGFSSLQARTWHSADGTKTFEGTFRAYDESSNMVTVVMNGKNVEFSANRLSKEDIAFVKEQDKSEPKEAVSEIETVIGSKVTKAKLHRLEGRRFKKAVSEKTPEYYLLYYSASW